MCSVPLYLFKRRRGYRLVGVKLLNQVASQRQGVKAVQLVYLATMHVRHGVPGTRISARPLVCPLVYGILVVFLDSCK